MTIITNDKIFHCSFRLGTPSVSTYSCNHPDEDDSRVVVIDKEIMKYYQKVYFETSSTRMIRCFHDKADKTELNH